VTNYSNTGAEYSYSQIKTAIYSSPDLFEGLDLLTVKKSKAWLPGHVSVFNSFMAEARKSKAAGYQRYSARAIWHYLRHLHQVDESTRHIKLTNIVTPVLARLAMELDPDLRGFFTTRTGGGHT
jgi:hypothetical protein